MRCARPLGVPREGVQKYVDRGKTPRTRHLINDGLPSLIDVCDSKAWEMKAYEGTSSLPQRRRRSVNQ